MLPTLLAEARARRLRLTAPENARKEVVHSLAGVRRIIRRLGPWVGIAPDDSILRLRDTSIDQILALELE